MASTQPFEPRRTNASACPTSRCRTPWCACCSPSSCTAPGRSTRGIHTTVSDFIYLASQSPRRRQLLEQLGIRHELLLPGDDEDAEAIEAVRGGESPATYVQRVTGLKLDAAMARLQRRGLPPAPVLCSDTTVALGRTIYGKPDGDATPPACLRGLSAPTPPGRPAGAGQPGASAAPGRGDPRGRFRRPPPARGAAYVAGAGPTG